MTVQTNTNSIAYVGNGSTVHFDYDFLILDASHLKVYFGDVLQTSGYVVSGVLSQTGGTVAFAVAPPSGIDITLTRSVPFLQLTDYQPYDAFPAESHERALDLLTMMAQQLKDSSDRSMQYPVGGNKWDAKNNEIINAGTGLSDSSVPNIGQVKQIIQAEVGDDPSASASIRSREALRRSCAEAGYNLVAGSFETGGTLASADDVLIQDNTGRTYSGTGPFPQHVTAGTNPSAAGFVDRSGSIYGLATVADISTGRFSVGALLRVSDRNYEIFRVVSGGTANNIDILPAGSGRTAVIADLSGIKSASAFGAKLDWNGVTGTDETAVFQRIHELGVNYAMDGKFSKITATLPMKSNQKVYFFGGGFYKPNSGYIISTNNVAVDNFIGYNGYFTGNLQADLIDMSGAGGGYPNSAKNCKLIDCNATQMYVLFNMSNARACQIVRGRYAGHTALQYTNKSAECIVESALLIKDENYPTAGTKGVWAFAGADGYPEGLTVKDSLIFRFERNYAIDDLFIGKLHGNYIDSGDDCLQSYVRYGTKTEGVDIVNNWFFQRGLVIGKPGEVAPRQFRMLVDGNHFNAMKPGVDIEIERWSHGVNLGINHHNSDQTGVHVCVTALGNNNGIIIQGLNPIGYTQYVQMKGFGEHNSISNIPNVDGLAAPLSLEYPVNVYNVEGYYSLSEGGLAASPYAAGAVVASADNVLLSAGIAHLSFDMSRLSIAGDGFLRIAAYRAGTFDPDDNVVIAAVSGFVAYSSADSSIRFSFPVAVKKATKTTFAVIVHSGSATITGGVAANDGIVVMQ